jgi:tetratricopeptide (TPR) repeat protein
MRKFSSAAAVFALIAALGTAVAGCGRIGTLKARMSFKDANALYQQQDYKAAAAKYEETIANCRGSEESCADPDLTAAYFFLGNSYDQLYRPTKRGDATNDEYMTKAIQNYRKSAELEKAANIRQLAMQYLVAAYGPDKLNEPEEAEPVIQRMIEMDPKDPTNYFALAKIYADNGDYEKAEEQYLKAKEVKPNDPSVYTQLAGFYETQGMFEKMMEALKMRLQQEPNNPEAYYTVATKYWEKAYRDFTTPEADKVKYVQEGIVAVDKAIDLKNDYFEALSYKNLLLRVQANLEKNPARQQQLLKEADQFRDKAQEIRNKQRAAGASD